MLACRRHLATGAPSTVSRSAHVCVQWNGWQEQQGSGPDEVGLALLLVHLEGYFGASLIRPKRAALINGTGKAGRPIRTVVDCTSSLQYGHELSIATRCTIFRRSFLLVRAAVHVY